MGSVNFKLDWFFPGQQILILGFGMEGKSTARFLRTYCRGCQITIADKNQQINTAEQEFRDCKFILGDTYLEALGAFDLVIKSPGIPNSLLKGKIEEEKLTSQTDIFLRLFRDQIVGVTGTKGKSTTSTLIHSILEMDGKDVLLLGNIGKPPLDFAARIGKDTLIIFEMSSHQLDGIRFSPHIAVFLNLFEEHLDHYRGIDQYRKAKYNIFKHQDKSDWLVYNADDQQFSIDVSELDNQVGKLAFSCKASNVAGAFCTPAGLIEFRDENGITKFDIEKRTALPGKHNLMNIMAAICVSRLIKLSDAVIIHAINQFPGLEHRLEYVGKFGGIHFYNDSIATIPEATIEAIKTLGQVDTLILGGKDRGINYAHLVRFLTSSSVRNIILISDVGNKLMHLLQKEQNPETRLFLIHSFDEIPEIVRQHTSREGICLLSPAASSYGLFSNFEERGRVFKQIAVSI